MFQACWSSARSVSCWSGRWPIFSLLPYKWEIYFEFQMFSFALFGSVNPLTLIGLPVTHENLPTNWPNFTALPALLGWPARNRHTAACIHRFSHILRWPAEPVVWFMSESRAVANEHEGCKWTLSIISSSFWMAVGVKGLTSRWKVWKLWPIGKFRIAKVENLKFYKMRSEEKETLIWLHRSRTIFSL